MKLAFRGEMLRVVFATVLSGVTCDPEGSNRLRVDAEVLRLPASELVLLVALPDLLPAVQLRCFQPRTLEILFDRNSVKGDCHSLSCEDIVLSGNSPESASSNQGCFPPYEEPTTARTMSGSGRKPSLATALVDCAFPIASASNATDYTI